MAERTKVVTMIGWVSLRILRKLLNKMFKEKIKLFACLSDFSN